MKKRFFILMISVIGIASPCAAQKTSFKDKFNKAMNSITKTLDKMLDPDANQKSAKSKTTANANMTKQKTVKANTFHYEVVTQKDPDMIYGESLSLYAVYDNGRKVSTDIADEMPELDIIAQGDFDGDGEPDALVYEWGGGNAKEPPYIVYYNRDENTFYRVDGLSNTMAIHGVEEWNGRLSLIEINGLRKDRYLFQNKVIKHVDTQVKEVGKKLKAFTVKGLFGVRKAPEERKVFYDLDGDGKNETITFSHDDSHVMNYGKFMALTAIKWGNGSSTDASSMQLSGESFSIMQSSTNGVHDIVVEDATIYRWNGTSYEEYLWYDSESEAGTAQQDDAPTPFTLVKPKFKKLVRINGKGVNLRSEPSAASQRLVYMEDEMGDLYTEWTSDKSGQSAAETGTVLPVLSEENGWYEAKLDDKTVYVMAKFCKDVAQRALPMNDNGFITLSSGKYSGYCFSLEESYGGSLLKIGQYVDGAFVFNYLANVNADNTGTTTIDKVNGISFNKKFSDEYGQPDLDKILEDSQMVDLLMRNIGKMDYSMEYYFGVVGNDEMHVIKE